MKLFSNLLRNGNDSKLISSKIKPQEKIQKKSKPLIIVGFILSISSIILLFFTINSKFG